MIKNLIVTTICIIFAISFITGNCFGDEKVWTKIYGSTTNDYSLAVSIDSAGNCYVAGTTLGEFDGQTNAGGFDICLTKYNSFGIKQWTRIYGSSADDFGNGVSIDSAGNCYVAGYTTGEFDGQINAGGRDICLTKYNSSGTKQWTRIYGSSADDYGNGVSVDFENNIYVAGATSGGFDGQINTGMIDICLTKFNFSGTKQWTKIYGSSENDYGNSVSVDSVGNIYVAGKTNGEFDEQKNIGDYDICLVKFNSFGTKQWTEIYGSPEWDSGNGVSVDFEDNIYVAGTTFGEFSMQTNAGASDICLTKFKPSKTKEWVRIYGSSDYDSGNSVSVDSAGNIYVAGKTDGEFDGQTNAGKYDICLTKYNSSIVKQWTEIYGSTENDYGLAVSANSVGDSYVAGYTEGEFYGQTNVGLFDICLTKFQYPVPFIDITNSDFIVELPATTAVIGGTNDKFIVIGNTMWWENTSTSGVSGTFFADVSRSWAIDNMQLVQDVNIITVSGTNIYGEVASDSITIDLVPEPFYLSFIIYYLLFIKRKFIFSFQKN